MEVMAFILGTLGMSFGISGFTFAVLTKKRVDKLERELTELKENKSS